MTNGSGKHSPSWCLQPSLVILLYQVKEIAGVKGIKNSRNLIYKNASSVFEVKPANWVSFSAEAN